MKYLIGLLLLLSFSKVSAQFNDSTSYYTNFTTTGSINKVNEGTSYLLNNALKFSVSKKNISFNSNSGWIYGKQFSILSNNDFYSTADFNVYTTPKFYVWALGNYNKSYSLKINNQFQTGGGVGYMFLYKKNAVVNVSDGLLYERGDLDNPDLLGRTHYETVRNSLRLKFKFTFHERVHLDGTNFWQPSLTERQDYILKSVTTLSVKLQKWLSLTSSLTYNKFNLNQRENLLWTFGLTIEKYY